MKRIGFIISAAFIIFTGCYDGNDTAKVRINLGNIPLAQNVHKKSFIDRVLCFFSKDAVAQTLPTDYGVLKLHLAAYKGDTLLAKESLDTADMSSSDNTVEFNVHAENGISILVVGETQSYDNNDNLINVAGYYGYNTEPVDLIAGETTDVVISNMSQAIWDYSGTYGLYFDINCSDNTLSWTSSGVRTKYRLINPNTSEVIWEGYSTGPIDAYGDLVVVFEAFNLGTVSGSSGGCK